MMIIGILKKEINKIFIKPISYIRSAILGFVVIIVFDLVFYWIFHISTTDQSYYNRYTNIEKDIREVKRLIDEGNFEKAEINCYLISYADTTDTENYLNYENQKKELLKLIEQKKYEENSNGNN